MILPFWLSLAILIVAIVGHAYLVRWLIGLIHTHLPRFAFWRRPAMGPIFVALMVIVGVAVPIFMVRDVGTRGAKVLRGRSWERVPAGWLAYIGVSVAAAGVEAASVVARARRRDPAIQVARSSRVENIAQLCERPPCGRGINGVIARFPGNQLLQLEVIERELHLPRLPREWDGLSIVHLSDTHYNGTPDEPFFAHMIGVVRELEPDMIVHTGDIIDHQRVGRWIEPTLGRLAAPLGCYFVIGNHDVYDEPETTRRMLVERGWTDVGGRSVVVRHRGSRLLIAGNEWPWVTTQPDVPSDDAADFRLLLAHDPQRYAWARRRGFDLVLAGHLHGGQICVPYFGSLRPGRYLGGLFHEGETVMHVSRGQGVMSPLRYGCRPEVTKLVLRANGRSTPGRA